MTKLFFIPKWIFLILVLINIIFFLNGDFLLFLICLTLTSLTLFFLRKRHIPFHNTLRNNGEVFLAPVFGSIKSIETFSPAIGSGQSDYYEIRITVSFWGQKGLYFPITGELQMLEKFDGKKIYRHSSPDLFQGGFNLLSRTEVTIMSQNNNQIFLKFINCFWGTFPLLWPRSGDRGRAGACFGIYPFGGTLIVQLPLKSDILVYENEKIVPGQTVIGFIKN